MNSECDKCDLQDGERQCYIYEMEKKISFLEEGLDQLTDIVKEISDHMRKEEDER